MDRFPIAVRQVDRADPFAFPACHSCRPTSRFLILPQ
jgi:hypothetical protein